MTSILSVVDTIPGPTTYCRSARMEDSPMFFFFNNKEEVDNILALEGATVERIKLMENIMVVWD